MISVSRETRARLRAYAELIRKWNLAINLVSPSTIANLEHRHFEDSAQLFHLARPQAGNWVDLGSGGGLPGVVIAILSASTPLQISLVESDRRKAAFLSTVRRNLDLPNLSVINKRIETLDRQYHRYASARALASLQNLLPNLERQLAPKGEAWLLKGRAWKDEVDLARQAWSFDLTTFPSATDPESVVMKLRNIERHA